jgi:hypothetical protein
LAATTSLAARHHSVDIKPQIIAHISQIVNGIKQGGDPLTMLEDVLLFVVLFFLVFL